MCLADARFRPHIRLLLFMPSRPVLIFATSVLLLALVLAAGSFWFAPREQGSGKPLVGGPFTLTDHNGNRVTERSYPGKYLLIFFGYTYCPDVCPSELQVMSAALDQLGADAGRIQPLFVSIDPARDTPAVMKAYVANFHPRLVGLTGSPDETAHVAAEYRVAYSRVKGAENSPDYLMDHSTILYLMAPDGTYAKHFTYETDAKTLAEGLRQELK